MRTLGVFLREDGSKHLGVAMADKVGDLLWSLKCVRITQRDTLSAQRGEARS